MLISGLDAFWMTLREMPFLTLNRVGSLIYYFNWHYKIRRLHTAIPDAEFDYSRYKRYIIIGFVISLCIGHLGVPLSST